MFAKQNAVFNYISTGYINFLLFLSCTEIPIYWHTADKAKAQEIADKVKAKTWDQLKGGEKQTYIWQEAVIRYLQEADKKSIDDDKTMLRWIAEHLDNKYLHCIDKIIIESIIDAKLKEGKQNQSESSHHRDQCHS